MHAKVQATASAAALTTVLFWMLGFFAPEFMGVAPTGAEAAVTAILAVLAGQFMPSGSPTNVVGIQELERDQKYLVGKLRDRLESIERNLASQTKTLDDVRSIQSSIMKNFLNNSK